MSTLKGNMNNYINRKSNIASVVELFILFLLLLVVIVVITLACMTTREQSVRAGELTDAVICAENAAEVTKGAENAADAAALLEKMDGIGDVNVSGDAVTAVIDGFRVEIAVAADAGAADASGVYVDETIRIYPDSRSSKNADAIYQLRTGNYIR